MAGVSRVPSNYKLLGRHELTTAFTTSSTHTTFQDEGLTLSVSYQGGRVLRVSLNVHAVATGGTQGIAYQVLRTATSVMQSQIGFALPAASATSFSFNRVFNGPATAATETFKVQIKALTANTSVSSYGDASYVRHLVVEDLGPQ